jgi:hypothetical protein
LSELQTTESLVEPPQCTSSTANALANPYAPRASATIDLP